MPDLADLSTVPTMCDYTNKYQRVKKIHLLALMSSYCKMMVFSSLKLDIPYYNLKGSC